MTACFLGLLCAFIWQSAYGNRNYIFRQQLAQKAANSQQQLTALQDTRKGLEQRATLLRPGTVDADLLDEFARRDLNLGGKNDLILRLPN